MGQRVSFNLSEVLSNERCSVNFHQERLEGLNEGDPETYHPVATVYYESDYSHHSQKMTFDVDCYQGKVLLSCDHNVRHADAFLERSRFLTDIAVKYEVV